MQNIESLRKLYLLKWNTQNKLIVLQTCFKATKVSQYVKSWFLSFRVWLCYIFFNSWHIKITCKITLSNMSVKISFQHTTISFDPRMLLLGGFVTWYVTWCNYTSSSNWSENWLLHRTFKKLILEQGNVEGSIFFVWINMAIIHLWLKAQGNSLHIRFQCVLLSCLKCI